MDALTREHEALITATRIEWLAARIDTEGGVTVLRSRTSIGGDRVTLRLGGGVSLDLDLMTPKRARLATVTSVRSRCSESWTVRGRTGAGVHVTYVCSHIRITRG